MYYPGVFLYGLKKKQKSAAGIEGSGPRFEHGTFQLQVRSVTALPLLENPAIGLLVQIPRALVRPRVLLPLVSRIYVHDNFLLRVST
jgi:hypothetical protein